MLLAAMVILFLSALGNSLASLSSSCDTQGGGFPVVASLAAALAVATAYGAGRRLLYLPRRKLLVLSVLVEPVIALPMTAVGPQTRYTGPTRTDTAISGTVADYDGGGPKCADLSELHTVTLQRGESIRLSVESGLYWSITLPGGNTTIRRGQTLSQLANVEQVGAHETLYTASRSGEYRIGVSAEAYHSGSYDIYLDVDQPRSPPVPTRTRWAPQTPTGR